MNLHRLPERLKQACIRGLLAPAENRTGGRRNFGDWILATFGRGIAEHFMLPYNAKLWRYLLEQMSSQWIAERVAVPDIADILRRMERDEESTQWGPNAMFRYPRHGGSGAVWKAVASTLPQERIRYGERVVRVDAERRIASTAKGSEFPYDCLISSMPLDQLAGMLETSSDLGNVIVERRRAQGSPLAPRAGNHPAERDAYFECKRLAATATHVIGIGLEGQPPDSIRDKLWIYYPEPSVPFYRVTIMSNLSPENTPRPGETWSLMAEVSEDKCRGFPTRGQGRGSAGASVSEIPTYVDRLPERWGETS